MFHGSTQEQSVSFTDTSPGRVRHQMSKTDSFFKTSSITPENYATKLYQPPHSMRNHKSFKLGDPEPLNLHPSNDIASTPDSIFPTGTVSTLEFPEADAWRDVPEVLRDTIKNIVISLQESSFPTTTQEKNSIDEMKNWFEKRLSVVESRIMELESSHSTKINNCAIQIEQITHRESKFNEKIHGLRNDLQSTLKNQSDNLPDTIAQETQKARQYFVPESQLTSLEESQDLMNKRLLAVENSLQRRKKKRTGKHNKPRSISPIASIEKSSNRHKVSSFYNQPDISHGMPDIYTDENVEHRLSTMEHELKDVVQAVETNSTTIDSNTRFAYDLKLRESAIEKQVRKLERSMGVINDQMQSVHETYATKTDLSNVASKFEICDVLTKDRLNAEIHGILKKKQHDEKTLKSSIINSTEKAVTRADVGVLIEEYIRPCSQQLSVLKTNIVATDETVQLIGTALTGIHNTMVHQEQIRSLHGSLKSVQISMGEVREWVDNQLKKISGNPVFHNPPWDDNGTLADQIMAIRQDLSKQAKDSETRIHSLATQVQDKVDTKLLTKLMHQSATREEMQKYVEKKVKYLMTQQHKEMNVTGKDVRNSAIQYRTEIEDLHAKIKKLNPQIEANQLGISEIKKKLQEVLPPPPPLNQPVMMSNIIDSSICSSIKSPNKAVLNDEDFGILYQKLTFAMDEKMYSVASEISALRALFTDFKTHPTLRSGLWVWRSGSVKQGSAIPWNIEAHNSDSANFRFEPDSCTIRVIESGLYELVFSFYTRVKPSIQVLVNGESVMSAIHSPTYTVHHGQANANVTGIALSDYLNLPGRSTICLHWHGKLEQGVQGFISLRRLY